MSRGYRVLNPGKAQNTRTPGNCTTLFPVDKWWPLR